MFEIPNNRIPSDSESGVEKTEGQEKLNEFKETLGSISKQTERWLARLGGTVSGEILDNPVTRTHFYTWMENISKEAYSAYLILDSRAKDAIGKAPFVASSGLGRLAFLFSNDEFSKYAPLKLKNEDFTSEDREEYLRISSELVEISKALPQEFEAADASSEGALSAEMLKERN